MTVTSVTLQSESELVFAGTNFPSETCEGLFLGMISSSCVVNSASEVLVTFEKGVPTSSVDVTPELRFNATEASHYAVFDELAVVQNPLTITSTTAGVVSSFAGGRIIEVTASGLSSDVQLNKAEVRVCKKPCVMDTASSTASVFACKTPSISTSRSNSDFTIQEESNLTGEDILYSGMTEAMAKLSIDGSILPSISSSDNICHVGIAFQEGYVGVINEISFFLDEFDSN